MKRTNNSYSTLSLRAFKDTSIKDFIISDEVNNYPELLLRHPYMIDGVAVIICKTGMGNVKINLKEHVISANSVLTILPGFLIEIVSHSKDFEIEYLFFSFDFMSNLKLNPNLEVLIQIEQYPSLEIGETKTQMLLSYHALIVSIYKNSTQAYKSQITNHMISALILEITGLYQDVTGKESAATTRREEIFNQFVQLLIKNHIKERSITFYANKICITPKYLASIIKSVSGKQTLDHINEITVMHIKALLKFSNMTVLQISEELNFSSASFMGRFFKKYTGMTPVEYRES